MENIARGTTDSEIDSVTLSYLIEFNHYLGLWDYGKIIIVPLLKFGLIVCLLPFDDFTQSFKTCSESSHFSVGAVNHLAHCCTIFLGHLGIEI